ncbi:MAG: hypothetical protein KJS95_09020 [Gammaproteobacteria bacterium]|nr:hypothetical protein [Gammaproteobacteria bacterium]
MELHAAYGQCLQRLRVVNQRLGLQANEQDLARISELVVQPLTGPWRLYHTIEHIFDVGGSEDPLEIVAALFHDVVYIQVDHSINFNLARYITPFVREEKALRSDMREGLVVREQAEIGDDRMFALVSMVFGIEPGERLSPQSGQNEFLSALVAAKVLEGVFPPSAIAQVVACVEATIPFRASPAAGLPDWSERLHQRLSRANETLQLGMDEHILVAAVCRAVRLANRDVEGFAAVDPALFLDNTWNLLPETNHVLLSSAAYTVRDYRLSLQRMRGFLQWLNAETVFQRFADEPPLAEHLKRTAHVRRNLQVAASYLGAKLVTIAFLEAVSMRIGPDMPLSMLMGALPTDEGPLGPTLEGFLPRVDGASPDPASIAGTVLRLLETGRASAVSYDLKHSPLAAFFARSIGIEALLALLDEAESLFVRFDSKDRLAEKQRHGEAFIARFPAGVSATVITGVHEVFAARGAVLTG